MYIATIDCGTTNSRVYIVDEEGTVRAKAARKVGVRNTAITGSSLELRQGLTEAFDEASAEAGLAPGEISLVVSSGMITSELGFAELPHLWAPVDLDAVAGGVTRWEDDGLFAGSPAVYLIRGIKNRYDAEAAGIDQADQLDFMRGEETQVLGYLGLHQVRLPTTFAILSSHTKFIPVDEQGRIRGSLTTVSGQVYEALLKETFLSKSLRPANAHDTPQVPEGSEYRRIIELARRITGESGFLRALLVARFMDTLLTTNVEERKLYVEAVVASEDMRVLSRMSSMGFPTDTGFVLVGAAPRVHLYKQLLEMTGIRGGIETLSDPAEVDSLSIHGSLRILRRAAIL